MTLPTQISCRWLNMQTETRAGSRQPSFQFRGTRRLYGYTYFFPFVLSSYFATTEQENRCTSQSGDNPEVEKNRHLHEIHQGVAFIDDIHFSLLVCGCTC
jgi:hypothetical protein